MKVIAPAKLNLTFKVLGKRPDGYHELESIVAFTEFGDELVLEQAERFSYHVEGPYAHHVPEGSEEDLLVKAVRVFEKETGIEVLQKIILTKNIPAGAGLGGGSSDAAAVLKALNEIYESGFSEEKLCEIGGMLGNDIPVCIRQRPTLVKGKGEKLSDAILPYKGYVLLIWPNSHCSTQAVFQQFHQFPPRKKYTNDLTPAAISLCPVIGSCLESLIKQENADYLAMSGSGSSCFAIFSKKNDALKALESIQDQYPDWWGKAASFLP